MELSLAFCYDSTSLVFINIYGHYMLSGTCESVFRVIMKEMLGDLIILCSQKEYSGKTVFHRIHISELFTSRKNLEGACSEVCNTIYFI